MQERRADAQPAGGRGGQRGGRGSARAAADWTLSREQEGGGAAAAEVEGRFPADAKKNPRLFLSNQLQPPQRLPQPLPSPPPVLSRF